MAPVTPEPAVIAAPAPAEAPPAEEEAPAPAPTITGYVEAAYHIAFMNPHWDAPVPLHGFYDPTGNTFLLHGAHLAINHSFNENVSATIEFDAGFDAAANGTLDHWWNPEGDATATIPFDVQEAYATYKSGIFSVTAGKFVTYEGIEVVEGPLNPTITRGFLFGFAEPVTHTGVKFHFTGEKVDFGIGIVNGWDKLVDNNDFKTFIFKLGLKPSDSFLANISGTFGSETPGVDDSHRLSLDLTGAWTVSESFALWYQGNFGMDNIGGDGDTVSWFGFGLQPTYTAEKFTFGARAEIFSDPDNYRMAFEGIDGATYVNLTLTPGFILAQGFKVRVELRLDIATEEVLAKADDPGKAQLTGALGAEYVF
ncbi:MAG TPA: outer membrane beta-barrel protein [Polyangiales bacterium]|nr:outer membrane beta-barrel protein [Polyangiales bacterium]